MKKLITMKEAVAKIQDGMTVMVGGFLGCGSPDGIIDALVESGVKDLTLIGNDTAFPDRSVGKMVVAKQFKKIIVSHIGTNPETGRQMNAGETEVDLVPQGTLAERIRCGGFGLGGVLTPTGIGTEVEDEKQRIKVDGKIYLLETPLKADVAIIRGCKVDKKGNIYYHATARNFNPLMAMAAETVIVEAMEIVEAGELDPECIVTPFTFVDYIVGGDK
ncbi:butyryl-CoA:acetoacetate CoA-transferase alpha subunit [Dethiosulfatibacter aminovorans DSM 17477]|uniref:Butyryl-CoA:acetoacetate CoA-transferase alpha subunit n=1 Tax=Dethiosulfatibacter aminovorans DSM 17477 TaxID=1121476 RepID=A0A1M6J0Q9_9FIRM|nr:acetate CoA-transferase subunit alpha [Dethiosulfatibacter aminovorans]SHJ40306.1 butyryl-CoA:acetoacetate CoA-transferase alpha subunit [Dethiosulfatibacter aminovorans DSM 17477]